MFWGSVSWNIYRTLHDGKPMWWVHTCWWWIINSACVISGQTLGISVLVSPFILTHSLLS